MVANRKSETVVSWFFKFVYFLNSHVLLEKLMSQFVRYGMLLSLFVSMFAPQHALAKNPDADASVEELRAVLKSIHPYLPASEIKTEIDVFGSTSMDS